MTPRADGRSNIGRVPPLILRLDQKVEGGPVVPRIDELFEPDIARAGMSELDVVVGADPRRDDSERGTGDVDCDHPVAVDE